MTRDQILREGWECQDCRHAIRSVYRHFRSRDCGLEKANQCPAIVRVQLEEKERKQ